MARYVFPELLHQLGISRMRFAAAAAVYDPGPLLQAQAAARKAR
ncbi:hypothetical protein C8N24_4902 [Solirubrobacter pauli]|uniref:Uncharacterized protein n=1 Tax=Solirubrobacter pauli TaxID=166793 RepID=A0A660KZ22_9ACTN|nr:hypothetical protein [Solirubrobacter pauli]RKQ86886.1 hypothetical protein C8N24_4902 [Solirubrobacter pauli]